MSSSVGDSGSPPVAQKRQREDFGFLSEKENELFGLVLENVATKGGTCWKTLADSIWAPKNYEKTVAMIAERDARERPEKKKALYTISKVADKTAKGTEVYQRPVHNPIRITAAPSSRSKSRSSESPSPQARPASGGSNFSNRPGAVSKQSISPETRAMLDRHNAAARRINHGVRVPYPPDYDISKNAIFIERKLAPVTEPLKVVSNVERIIVSAAEYSSIKPHLRHAYQIAVEAPTVVQKAGEPTIDSDEKAVKAIINGSAEKNASLKSDTSSKEETEVSNFVAYMLKKDAADRAKAELCKAKRAEEQKNAREQAALQARADMQCRNTPSSLDPTVQAAKTTTPWALPTGKFVANTKHTHFCVDVGAKGTGEFEAFLQRKQIAPVVNGKVYTMNHTTKVMDLGTEVLTPLIKEDNTSSISKHSLEAAFSVTADFPKTIARLSPHAVSFTPSSATSSIDLPKLAPHQRAIIDAKKAEEANEALADASRKLAPHERGIEAVKKAEGVDVTARSLGKLAPNAQAVENNKKTKGDMQSADVPPKKLAPHEKAIEGAKKAEKAKEFSASATTKPFADSNIIACEATINAGHEISNHTAVIMGKSTSKLSPQATPFTPAIAVSGGFKLSPQAAPFTHSAFGNSSEKSDRSSEWNCYADTNGPLPEGWTRRIDPHSGHVYYENCVDQFTTWNRPGTVCVADNIIAFQEKVDDGTVRQDIMPAQELATAIPADFTHQKSAIIVLEQSKTAQNSSHITSAINRPGDGDIGVQQQAKKMRKTRETTTNIDEQYLFAVNPQQAELSTLSGGSATRQEDPTRGWPKNCMPTFQKQGEDIAKTFAEKEALTTTFDEFRAESPDEWMEMDVSDTGVDDCYKENIRGRQGKDATEEFLDWSGERLPPPCIWEDRETFDTSYVGAYVLKEWLPHVKRIEVAFDLSTPNYINGTSAVNNTQMDEPVVHGPCIPDIANSENEQNRLERTAELEIKKYNEHRKVYIDTFQQFAIEKAIRHQEIAMAELQPNPFAPKLDMYLRPALDSDAADIAAVYNHYVKKSVVTEDTEIINVADVNNILNTLKLEKLPCIVAVKGRMPSSPQTKRGSQQPKVAIPQYENIIGFAFAGSYGYGLNTFRTGRSKTTLDLQLFVHPDYTRKGVGRNLMDRLIQCCSLGYAAKDGADWINPTNNQVYNSGGASFYHQLVLQIPVIGGEKEPKVPAWQSDLLSKFWFDQTAVLKGVGRTRGGQTDGVARFIDTIIFMKQACRQQEFANNF